MTPREDWFTAGVLTAAAEQICGPRCLGPNMARFVDFLIDVAEMHVGPSVLLGSIAMLNEPPLRPPPPVPPPLVAVVVVVVAVVVVVVVTVQRWIEARIHHLGIDRGLE